MSEISPTARALRALDILQSRPGITATDLAQRLGVTERAARRYVAILREADIPVESSAAITRPSASVAEKTSGGSRRPRPRV